MNTRITQLTVWSVLGRRLTAFLLSALLLLGVFSPVISTATYAEETVSYRFHFENRKGEGVSDVRVVLTRDIPEDGGNSTAMLMNHPTAEDPDPEEPDPEEPAPEDPVPELPTSFEAVSDADGNADFSDLPAGSYTYSLTVPEGYLSLNGAAIEITAEGSQSFTLYASAPTASISLVGSFEYADAARIEVNASGYGELSYAWFKDNELLKDETKAFLEFPSLEFSDSGLYRCEIRSDLCDPQDENTVIKLEKSLEVVRCTPQIDLSFSPKSGTSFSKTGVTITASVHHPSNNSASAPEGEVTFYVLYEDGRVTSKSKTLRNGTAEVRFQLKNGGYTIYASYSSAISQTLYAAADSDHYAYSVGQKTPIENIDYTINEPTGNHGWYNSSGPLVIAPTENGDYDRIRLADSDTAEDRLEITDETNGSDISFVLIDSESGAVSGKAVKHFKMDVTKPSSVEHRLLSSEYAYLFFIEFFATDNLSGVEMFRLYSSETEYTTVYSVLDRFVSLLSADDFQELLFYTAVDYAGNESDRCYLSKKAATVSFSEPTCVTKPGGERLEGNRGQTDSLYFHLEENTPLSFTITAEGMTSTDEISIYVNGVALENAEWTMNSDNPNIMVFQSDEYSAEGEYVVTVYADDYVLFCEDYLPVDGKVVCNVHSFTSSRHIIDKTAPVFGAAYSPTEPEENYAAYSGTRSAVITVAESYFRPENLEIIDFSATDIAGNHLDNEDVLKEQLLMALRGNGWQQSGTTHTSPTLSFEEDARYSFKLGCEDFGGNKGYYTSESFIVDNTVPEDLSITYEPEVVSTFMEIITFGFYQTSVKVTVRAEDQTSGVDHFNVFYHQEEGSHSLGDHDEEIVIPSEDIEIQYDSTGRIAEATFTLSASEYRQYRGSLSFTASDRAGKTSDIKNGDGTAIDSEGNEFDVSEGTVVVVDNIKPVCKVTIPEPQLIRDNNKSVFNGKLEDYEKLQVAEKNDYFFYYTRTNVNPVTFTVQITEANFDPNDEDLVIKLNNVPLTNIEWTREDEKNAPNSWTTIINLSTDNEYRINIDYTDHSGNVMDSYQSCRIVLDRVNPEITQFSFNPSTVDGDSQTSQFIDRLEYGYYFKTDFAVTVSASDAEISSGLHYVACRLISYKDGKPVGEESQIAAIQNGKAYLKIPSGFKGQIFAECYDYAGNNSAEVTPQGMIVDHVGPDVSIVTNQNTGFHDAMGNRLFTGDTSLTVTIRDTVSGLKRLQCRQQSEKATGDWIVTEIANTGIQLGSTLANGWVVSSMDQNLVTSVTKTFSYTEDDNDIFLTVSAADRSENTSGEKKSETFTVDKTAPVITAAFDNGPHEGIYYNKARSVVVTVRERNFDAGRINTAITNAIGAAPAVRYEKLSDTEYRAVLDFPQGDYTFDVSGTDLGGHNATVTFTGGNEHEFVVDTTKPSIVTNFDEFTDPAHENHFAKAKTAVITITEHNFSPDLVHLNIYQRAAGSSKVAGGFQDVTEAVLKNAQWTTGTDTDVHTLQFTLEDDAVYQIELEPVDLAGNQAGKISTQIFEIDKTVPVIVSRGDRAVGPDDVNFLDIYDHARENDPVPKITFKDTNLQYLEYQLFVWIPDYSNKNQYPEMQAVQVYLPEDPDHTGRIYGDTITLSNFSNDGIYTLKATAVDMAGNRSVENNNTYVRIVKSPILAYIEDSNLSKGTGLFSFENEDGTPISMRSDGFMDLAVVVFSQTDSAVEVVLRDGNGDETAVGDYAGSPSAQYEEIYGIDVGRYIIPKERFSELYPDDTDAKLYLSVKNDSEKLDLGVIHIDNIVPNCVLPDGLHSWKWYVGNSDRTFTITNISEALDIENCAVYDNGVELKNIVYSPEDATIQFTLSKGWHNIGIKLTDLAGNTNNIQELTHIQIGLFWMWIILAALGIIGTGIVCGIRSRRKKAEREE